LEYVESGVPVRVTATIRAHLGRRAAEALAVALKPDDTSAPRGFKLVNRVEGDYLVYEVTCSTCSTEDLLTLASTVSELLLMVYSIPRALESVPRGA